MSDSVSSNSILALICRPYSHIREVADGYAAAGFVAIAPALYDRVQPGIELGYSQDIEKLTQNLISRAPRPMGSRRHS